MLMNANMAKTNKKLPILLIVKDPFFQLNQKAFRMTGWGLHLLRELTQQGKSNCHLFRESYRQDNPGDKFRCILLKAGWIGVLFKFQDTKNMLFFARLLGVLTIVNILNCFIQFCLKSPQENCLNFGVIDCEFTQYLNLVYMDF